MVIARIGSTPYITITAEETALQGAVVFVSIEQDGVKILKNSTDDHKDIRVEPIYDADGYQIETDVIIHLSQQETLQFKPGIANVQLRWIWSDNEAYVSDIAILPLATSLTKGVIYFE